MIVWSYAYQQARKGHWIQVGIDHHRFQRHIRTIEIIIAPILTPGHRAKICSLITPTKKPTNYTPTYKDF